MIVKYAVRFKRKEYVKDTLDKFYFDSDYNARDKYQKLIQNAQKKTLSKDLFAMSVIIQLCEGNEIISQFKKTIGD